MAEYPHHSPAAGISFLLAVVAASLTAALTIWWLAPDSAEAGPGPTPPDPARLQAIEGRLAAIERRLDASVRATPASIDRAGAAEPSAPDTGPTRVPVDAPVDVTDLLQRLARLERSFAEDGSADPPVPTAPPKPPEQVERERLAAIAEAQQRILDPRSTEADKLAAWRALRDQGEDIWTDAVVFEMIRTARASQDPSVRADVWRQADGRARHPALVAPMLEALAGDVAPDVREEAAETLAEYRSRPGVEQALQFAAENDADDGVRRQARRSLGQRDRR